MRLLWLSNSPRVPTGYGNQTRVFLPRLKKSGHDLALCSFYGIEGSPIINDMGIVELPRLIDAYGNDAVGAHYAYHKADAVVTLVDPFVLVGEIYANLNWIAWTPIDSEPIFPPTVRELRSAKRIWTMSRFGERLLKAAGFLNVDYVPHGIEGQTTFKPVDKAAALTKLKSDAGADLADKFVVTMNSANKGAPSRKNFFGAFAAFKAFSDNHPDAVLYVHTEMNGIFGGEHLPTIAGMVGLDSSKIVYAPYYHLVNGMLPPDYLNSIYNVSDVLINTSYGEGFGIPVVEAQMAGCPVIVPGFSATDELCFAGWKVPGTPFMNATGATQRIPIIGKLIEALEASYQKRGDAAFRAQARAGALAYDADVVYKKYMKPAMKRIEADMVTAAAIRQAQADLKAGKRPAPIPTGKGRKPMIANPASMLLDAGGK